MTAIERRRAVVQRANSACEYCRLPQSAHPQTFEVDHVVSRQHGGGDALDNFALSCPHCNRHKGPNVASVTPDLHREPVLLFDPRRHAWGEHFGFDPAIGLIAGRTDVGRATVHVLAMNASLRPALRRLLVELGEYVPSS